MGRGVKGSRAAKVAEAVMSSGRNIILGQEDGRRKHWQPHVVQQENVPCEIGSILSSLCGWAGRHWRFHQEIDHQTLSVWACGPQ